MGMFAAVGSVYANMFNYSGRARRAEYWWFFLFIMIMSLLVQGAAFYWVFTHPQFSVAFRSEAAMQTVLKQYEDEMTRWSLYYFLGSLILYWLPQLAVTVRRLHDTGRSGWWMFKPFLLSVLGMIVVAVLAGFTGAATGEPSPALMLMAMTLPLAASIWYVVVLCLPGTHGNNRFGPDPIPNRPPRTDRHPALVKEMDEELGRMVAERRKEEFQDYYRARVLPAIERTKSARRV